MKFILKINMSGAAFADQPERELDTVIVKALNWIDELGIPLQAGDAKALLDSNGNTCGFWKVVEVDD